MQITEKRNEIDSIDLAIVELINQRAAVAREISVLKLSAGLPIVDEQREQEVIRRLTQASAGDVDAAAVRRIYRTILDESRRIQAEVRAELAQNGTIV